MKKMIIFEPAMCCATGVCGPSVDPELLRVTTVVNNLMNNSVPVERHNLMSNPQIFVDNKVINDIINTEGVDVLPVTVVDGEVMKMKTYPTNEEFVDFLQVTEEKLKAPTLKNFAAGCGCDDGCC